MGHYSDYATNPKVLRKVAMWLAAELEQQYPEELYGLFFTGLSGTSLAYAMMQYLDPKRCFPMYVRKTHERSHGHDVEIFSERWHDKALLPVFVDDFLSTGKTLNNCWQAVKPLASFKVDVKPIAVLGCSGTDENDIWTWNDNTVTTDKAHEPIVLITYSCNHNAILVLNGKNQGTQTSK